MLQNLSYYLQKLLYKRLFSLTAIQKALPCFFILTVLLANAQKPAIEVTFSGKAELFKNKTIHALLFSMSHIRRISPLFSR
jgi:hypothetical protein